MITRSRLALGLGAVATAGTLATTTPVVAGAQQPAAYVCPVGYVCLFCGPAAAPVRIPSGQSRTFSPALHITAATNATRLNYCVAGALSFGLPPGQSIVRDDSVSDVSPGQVCPF